MGYKIPEQPNVNLEAGVWADYEGAQFRIAYATNDRFMRLKTRNEKPHRREIEKGDLDPTKQKKILIKSMAEAILVDWRGLDGDVPYSVKSAEQALTNDERLREFVMNYAMDLANFIEDERAHEGNS